eukprot:c22067_g1_i1 orf=969-1151(+)
MCAKSQRGVSQIYPKYVVMLKQCTDPSYTSTTMGTFFCNRRNQQSHIIRLVTKFVDCLEL